MQQRARVCCVEEGGLLSAFSALGWFLVTCRAAASHLAQAPVDGWGTTCVRGVVAGGLLSAFLSSWV
eukprot:6203846-Prorocentrum_lima.AAC.1